MSTCSLASNQEDMALMQQTACLQPRLLQYTQDIQYCLTKTMMQKEIYLLWFIVGSCTQKKQEASEGRQAAGRIMSDGQCVPGSLCG